MAAGRAHSIPKGTKDQAIAMWKRGASNGAIETILGLSKGSTRNWPELTAATKGTDTKKGPIPGPPYEAEKTVGVTLARHKKIVAEKEAMVKSQDSTINKLGRELEEAKRKLADLDNAAQMTASETHEVVGSLRSRISNLEHERNDLKSKQQALLQELRTTKQTQSAGNPVQEETVPWAEVGAIVVVAAFIGYVLGIIVGAPFA
jgi:ElaB/YqjD/DUF883 family membrane-anchored ribosome-binding protein